MGTNSGAQNVEHFSESEVSGAFQRLDIKKESLYSLQCLKENVWIAGLDSINVYD